MIRICSSSLWAVSAQTWYWTVLTAKLHSKFLSHRPPNHLWTHVNSWHICSGQKHQNLYDAGQRLLLFWNCLPIVLFGLYSSYLYYHLFAFFKTLMILNIPTFSSITSFPSYFSFMKALSYPWLSLMPFSSTFTRSFLRWKNKIC